MTIAPSRKWRRIHRSIICLVAIIAALFPISTALHASIDFPLTTTLLFSGVYLIVCTVIAATLFCVPVDCQTAWTEVDRVENSCQAILVVMTLLFGLVQFFQTPKLKVPDSGFALLLCCAAYLVIGVVPFGPRKFADSPPTAQGEAIRLARVIHALKAVTLAAALLCLGLVAFNIERLNPNPTLGLPGFVSK